LDVQAGAAAGVGQEGEDHREDDDRQHDRAEQAERAEPDAGPDVASVCIRLPDGTKVKRRFLMSTSLKVIFDYVDSHELKCSPMPSQWLDIGWCPIFQDVCGQTGQRICERLG